MLADEDITGNKGKQGQKKIAPCSNGKGEK